MLMTEIRRDNLSATSEQSASLIAELAETAKSILGYNVLAKLQAAATTAIFLSNRITWE